jgi:hypothetical protein
VVGGYSKRQVDPPRHRVLLQERQTLMILHGRGFKVYCPVEIDSQAPRVRFLAVVLEVVRNITPVIRSKSNNCHTRYHCRQEQNNTHSSTSRGGGTRRSQVKTRGTMAMAKCSRTEISRTLLESPTCRAQIRINLHTSFARVRKMREASSIIIIFL